MERIVVLSLLEDLQFSPPPLDALFPGAADVASPRSGYDMGAGEGNREGHSSEFPEDDGFGGGASAEGDGSAASGLLTAGEGAAVEAVAEEPPERQARRIRAVYQLPFLALKMGVRWSSAELVPYLLRCVEEDVEGLSLAVARVLPVLLGLCSTLRGPLVLAAPASCYSGGATSASSSSPYACQQEHVQSRALLTATLKPFTEHVHSTAAAGARKGSSLPSPLSSTDTNGDRCPSASGLLARCPSASVDDILCWINAEGTIFHDAIDFSGAVFAAATVAGGGGAPAMPISSSGGAAAPTGSGACSDPYAMGDGHQHGYAVLPRSAVAPVLLALCGVGSSVPGGGATANDGLCAAAPDPFAPTGLMLLRAYIARVTVPLVCFGAPFKLFPFYVTSPSLPPAVRTVAGTPGTSDSGDVGGKISSFADLLLQVPSKQVECQRAVQYSAKGAGQYRRSHEAGAGGAGPSLPSPVAAACTSSYATRRQVWDQDGVRLWNDVIRELTGQHPSARPEGEHGEEATTAMRAAAAAVHVRAPWPYHAAMAVRCLAALVDVLAASAQLTTPHNAPLQERTTWNQTNHDSDTNPKRTPTVVPSRSSHCSSAHSCRLPCLAHDGQNLGDWIFADCNVVKDKDTSGGSSGDGSSGRAEVLLDGLLDVMQWLFHYSGEDDDDGGVGEKANLRQRHRQHPDWQGLRIGQRSVVVIDAALEALIPALHRLHLAWVQRTPHAHRVTNDKRYAVPEAIAWRLAAVGLSTPAALASVEAALQAPVRAAGPPAHRGRSQSIADGHTGGSGGINPAAALLATAAGSRSLGAHFFATTAAGLAAWARTAANVLDLLHRPTVLPSVNSTASNTADVATASLTEVLEVFASVVCAAPPLFLAWRSRLAFAAMLLGSPPRSGVEGGGGAPAAHHPALLGLLERLVAEGVALLSSADARSGSNSSARMNTTARHHQRLHRAMADAVSRTLDVLTSLTAPSRGVIGETHAPPPPPLPHGNGATPAPVNEEELRSFVLAHLGSSPARGTPHCADDDGAAVPVLLRCAHMLAASNPSSTDHPAATRGAGGVSTTRSGSGSSISATHVARHVLACLGRCVVAAIVRCPPVFAEDDYDRDGRGGGGEEAHGQGRLGLCHRSAAMGEQSVAAVLQAAAALPQHFADLLRRASQSAGPSSTTSTTTALATSPLLAADYRKFLHTTLVPGAATLVRAIVASCLPDDDAEDRETEEEEGDKRSQRPIDPDEALAAVLQQHMPLPSGGGPGYASSFHIPIAEPCTTPHIVCTAIRVLSSGLVGNSDDTVGLMDPVTACAALTALVRRVAIPPPTRGVPAALQARRAAEGWAQWRVRALGAVQVAELFAQLVFPKLDALVARGPRNPRAEADDSSARLEAIAAALRCAPLIAARARDAQASRYYDAVITDTITGGGALGSGGRGNNKGRPSSSTNGPQYFGAVSGLLLAPSPSTMSGSRPTGGVTSAGRENEADRLYLYAVEHLLPLVAALLLDTAKAVRDAALAAVVASVVAPAVRRMGAGGNDYGRRSVEVLTVFLRDVLVQDGIGSGFPPPTATLSSPGAPGSSNSNSSAPKPTTQPPPPPFLVGKHKSYLLRVARLQAALQILMPLLSLPPKSQSNSFGGGDSSIGGGVRDAENGSHTCDNSTSAFCCWTGALKPLLEAAARDPIDNVRVAFAQAVTASLMLSGLLRTPLIDNIDTPPQSQHNLACDVAAGGVGLVTAVDDIIETVRRRMSEQIEAQITGTGERPNGYPHAATTSTTTDAIEGPVMPPCTSGPPKDQTRHCYPGTLWKDIHGTALRLVRGLLDDRCEGVRAAAAETLGKMPL